MPKANQGNARTKKYSLNTRPIPLHISQFIKGRTVTIPKASGLKPERFFTKQWRAMLPAISQRAKISEVGPSQFDLEPELFDRFMIGLRAILGPFDRLSHSTSDPADWIAQALCTIAQEVFPSGIEDEQSNRRVETCIWQSGRPVIEAWHQWSPLAPAFSPVVLPAGEAIFEYSKEHGLRPASGKRGQHPRLAIKTSFNSARSNEELPELTISLRGDALPVLLTPTRPFPNFVERDKHQKLAKQIWEVVSHWLSLGLGVKYTRGKPRRDLGFEAAWLHHHKGLSWKEVAEQICPLPHSHDFKCHENLRKQSEHYWRNQREKYAALVNLKS